MVFSSAAFVFAFLPAVLACYFLLPRRARLGRNAVLLVFSLFFYFYGEPRGIFVMAFSIAVNYLGAFLLDRPGARYRREILFAALCANLLTLGYYKYTGFVVTNLVRVLDLDWAVPQIIMPIGISFFTFQGMSYLMDVYRRQVPAQKNPLNVAMYISLFPQLVAGPIVRYQTVAQEIVTRRESLEGVSLGLRRFCLGLFKKMLLSNAMGQMSTDLFGRGGAALSSPEAWLGAIAYTFHIFFDFSAYSDMAIGLGRIFGFHFLENFNYPYIAQSITDFWRRWHMSLSQWFRDYVYIPLGGNRCSPRRQGLNLLIVWGLTGLWHGAAWNFIAWGFYFALLLMGEKFLWGKALAKWPRPLRHGYSLLLIVLGWVLFNAGSLSAALQYARAMFAGGFSLAGWHQVQYYLTQYRTEWVLCLACSLPIGPALARRWQGRTAYQLAASVGAFGLLLLSLLAVVNTSFNPFIYFRF